MPSSSPILQLRQAIRAKSPIKLFPEDSNIKTATSLIIDTEKIPLTELTYFEGSDQVNHQLRTIYQCWLHNESNTSTYINDCNSNDIPVISFMERTELISFLNSSSETCEYLKIELPSQTSASSTKENDKKPSSSIDSSSTDINKENKRRRIENDPFLKEIINNERDLVDHNKALRGSKPIDFSSVARECEHKIIRASKSNKSSLITSTSSSSKSRPSKPSSSSSSFSASSSSSSGVKNPNKNKDPIIILSPSASALLTMNNVKDFLQEGKFIDTTALPSSSHNMLHIQRDSKKFSRKMKFVVVNNVDKFFTKPEHWDRVVAVFTTGQEWQFKNYKYNEPNVLFQKVKGFYVHFNGDIVPPKINSWNVQPIGIDRNQRFKDRQTSEFLWESLERFMSTKGYK